LNFLLEILANDNDSNDNEFQYGVHLKENISMQSTLTTIIHAAARSDISHSCVHLLTQSNLLRDIAPEQTAQLLKFARIAKLKARSSRIDSCELRQNIYFVTSGEMRVMKPTPDGQECLLRRVDPGEFFCLSSLFSGQSCTNHCVATIRTETLCWRRKQFEQFMHEAPHIYRNLSNLMADEVEQERQMRSLTHCCRADVKVAAYLLHRAQKFNALPVTINLRPTGVTAQEIGIARETLSRTIRRMEDLGLITYRQGKIRLTELQTLENFLENAEDLCDCNPCVKSICNGH
jgi:CRP-like cAMP-binding protein